MCISNNKFGSIPCPLHPRILRLGLFIIIYINDSVLLVNFKGSLQRLICELRHVSCQCPKTRCESCTTSIVVLGIARGDYAYCRMPGTWQLSPLWVGEDNSNLEPKILRKVQFHQYGQTKSYYRVFRHAAFNSGLYFGLALLPHKVLATF